MLNMTGMGLSHTGGSASWSYGYNNVHQMTSQGFSDTGFQWRPAASSTIGYGTANSLNQYPTVGAASLSYNGDGCLTGDGTWTYTYDVDNRLLTANKTGVSVAFDYDGSHRQIQKTVGSVKTIFVYAGDQLFCEYDGTGTLLNRYVYGFEADDPILQITAGGVITYIHQDHNGSVIANSDNGGNILNKYKYSPFGESPSLAGTLFGFTGQRFDSELGLYHYKARYYDPATGRFLQPDPIGYKDGLNLYAYVTNDPLNFVDSGGMAKKRSAHHNEALPDPFIDSLLIQPFYGLGRAAIFGGLKGLRTIFSKEFLLGEGGYGPIWWPARQELGKTGHEALAKLIPDAVIEGDKDGKSISVKNIIDKTLRKFDGYSPTRGLLEIKTGEIKLSYVEKQIKFDKQLIEGGTKIEWHFFPNKSGATADKAVLDALSKAQIPYKIHK